ncbi:MAG: SGNH/GDSL hydrolase family protein [Pseudobdellovibrio sp.]
MKIGKPAKAILLLLSINFLVVLIALYSQNDLRSLERWRTQKITMARPPAAPLDPMFNREMLALGRLNMHKNAGSEEYYFAKPLLLQKIKIKFNINEFGSLDLLFNNDGGHFSGVRISTEKDDNIYFDSEMSSKFSLREPYNPSWFPKSNEWHEAEIEQTQAGLVLSIDGKAANSFSGKKFSNGRFGLRSNRAGALVSHVQLTDQNGNETNEKFIFDFEKVPQVFLSQMVLTAAALMIIFLMVLIFCRKRAGLELLIKVQQRTLLFVLLYLIFDFFCYSSINARIEKTVVVADNPIFSYMAYEKYRFLFFKKWTSLIFDTPRIDVGAVIDPKKSVEFLTCSSLKEECNYVAYYEAKNKNKIDVGHAKYKVLFIGGSFTRGYGSREFDDAFVMQLFRRLKADVSPDSFEMTAFTHSPFEYAGFPSAVAFQVGGYNTVLANYKPDVIVATFLRGDADDLDRVKKFVEKTKKDNIKLVMLAQPTTQSKTALPSSRLKSLLETQKVFLDYYQENHIPIIDLNNELNSEKTLAGGVVWWDFVHITSYGQSVVADYLEPRLLKLLKEKN